MRSLLCVLALLATSCGPERRFSGVWQQVGAAETRAHAYELHVGRYGDGLAGLLVRYAGTGDDELDSFDPSAECGCFYLTGGKADADGFKFTVFEPDAPGQPAADFAWSDACLAGTVGRPKEEPDCVFDFEGDEDLLTLKVHCENEAPDPDDEGLQFVRVGSSPRTNCVVPDR